MAVVEIDETELGQYRQAVAFVQGALADPKTRRKILEVQKLRHPDVAIPEIDAADPILAEVQKLGERVEAFITETQQEKAAREDRDRQATLAQQWEAGRAMARARNYTDEGLKNLEDFMEKKGVADWEVGMAAYEQLNPAPPPAVTGSTHWHLFDQQTREAPDFKPLFDGDDETFLAQAVPAALRDVRQGR